LSSWSERSPRTRWLHDDENLTGLGLKIDALEHFTSIVTFAKPSNLKPDAPPFSGAGRIVSLRGLVSGRFHFGLSAVRPIHLSKFPLLHKGSGD
jgi:hypothetical protein